LLQETERETRKSFAPFFTNNGNPNKFATQQFTNFQQFAIMGNDGADVLASEGNKLPSLSPNQVPITVKIASDQFIIVTKEILSKTNLSKENINFLTAMQLTGNKNEVLKKIIIHSYQEDVQERQQKNFLPNKE
jgi:hypothetical protein